MVEHDDMIDNAPPEHAGRPRSAPWLLTIAALIGATAVFAMRGPLHAWSNNLDFVLVYSASRAWLVGADPYDKVAVDRAWLEAGGADDRRPLRRVESALIYPPPTLAMFAPFALLPARAAHAAWIIANVGFLAVSLWSIASLAGFRVDQRRTWLMVSGALVFMPVHTTIRFGQTPLYVLALVSAAAAIGNRLASGTMLGLASAIKPQLGLPFMAIEVVNRRWKPLMFAAIALVVVGLLSIIPLQQRGVDWWTAWRRNVAEHQVSGQGDPGPANPMRHQMVNLHVPLRAVADRPMLVNIVVLGAAAGLAAAFFLRPARLQSRSSGAALLDLSLVGALSLMIVYHRFYDAVFLLFALAWAVASVCQRPLRPPRPALGVLILLVPFLLNSNTALWWLNSRGRLPAWMTDHWWWDVLILPHQSWAILLMGICLLIASRRRHDFDPQR